MFEQDNFPVMFSCVRMGRLIPIHGVDGIEVVAQAVAVLKVGESVPTVWVRPALPGTRWGEWVAQSAQPIDAWMTEDGRIATYETKRTGMAGPSRVNFNIPLTRLSTKLLRAEGGRVAEDEPPIGYCAVWGVAGTTTVIHRSRITDETKAKCAAKHWASQDSLSHIYVQAVYAAPRGAAVDLSMVSDTALEDELRKRANRKSEN